jgi:hypothetical protein
LAERPLQDKDLRGGQVVVCKTGQTLPQIAMVLSDPVPLGGLGVGGAILLPVAAVGGTPLPCTIPAGFAILGIEHQHLLAVLAAALPLAQLVGADGLLRMQSGGLERPQAKTATPQVHPYRLTVLNRKGGKGGASLISASEKSHLGKNNGCNSRIVKQQLSSLAG